MGAGGEGERGRREARVRWMGYICRTYRVKTSLENPLIKTRGPGLYVKDGIGSRRVAKMERGKLEDHCC